MKAVIYCRVSSRAQKQDGHGLISQETRCREHAAAKGYDVAAVFPDTITGGGDFMKRPGMVALLSYLDLHPDEQFIIIFDDLKRFARDTKFHLDLREAFRKRRAVIECLNFKFDDTPEGEFIETIMAAQGALERKQNGRQVAQKMKACMQAGYWIHNAPIGYKYKTLKGRGRVLVHDERFASIIRKAFEGYAIGHFQTQAEVKRYFESFPDFPRNKHGEVKQQRVTDILTQPVYTGYICSETYELNWLKAQHEPLISLETFDKVQARRTQSAKLPMRKNIGDDFALRGFVECGDCSAPLRSSWSKGKAKHYAYYLCQTKGCDDYGKSIPRDKIEGDVGAIIKQLEPSHTLMELTRAMFKNLWGQQRDQFDQAMQSAKRQLTAIDKQLETVLARLMETTSGAVIRAYEQKVETLEASRARLEDQISHMTPPKQSHFEDVLELSLKFLANPYKIWENGKIGLKRLVLKLAFSERLTYHRNQGARTPKIALPFRMLEGFQTLNLENGAAERA